MAREIKLKICGMREVDNILAVSKLQPDFMGFIFYSPSPRYVGENFRIPEKLSPATKRVGVFVNENTDVIRHIVKDCQLDFVQLHGNESADQCREIRSEGVGVIKVFSVDDDMDFSITESYSGVVDYFLFDTKGKYYGGNAKAFDWEILARYDQKVPFFLSGGIAATHIEKIKTLNDYNLVAVDVNSGVEVRPAFKDLDQIKAIQTILNAK